MIKFGVFDKALAFVERHWRKFLSFAVFLFGLAFVFQDAVKILIEPHEAFLKLLALVLGPFATAIGFYLGYKSKQEMVEHSNSMQQTMDARARDLEVKANEIGKLTAQAQQRERELSERNLELAQQRTGLETERRHNEKLTANLRRVTESGNDLWNAYPPRPFSDYEPWLRAPVGAKIVTVGNLKGGVGKTTIAANLAAYISQNRDKPVLLIDLDYQGSLSNLIMFAAGQEEVPSLTDALFDPAADLATLSRSSIHVPAVLRRGWLVPASYTLAQTEGRKLMSWLMEPEQETDARYLLAKVLLHPEVRRQYSVIIIDMPPRMTLGAVCAMVASHHLIVPTALDRMSAEAVRQFLTMVRGIKNDLNLDLDLLGVVATLHRIEKLSEEQQRRWKMLGEHCQGAWNGERDYRFLRTIPHRAAIANAAGEAVAYNENAEVKAFFDELGDEVWNRMFPKLSTDLPQA